MMKRARILIVEDEQIIAEDLQEVLERQNFAVVCIADSGENALEEVSNTRPDIILMDIHLKGDIDGIETAKRIRENEDIPIIYLTSSSQGGDLEKAKQTDPYGYITKPFDPQTLATTIEIALHKHRIDSRTRISLETYRFIAEYTASWEMWLDANDVPVYISPSCERITGYSPGEISARSILLTEMILPEDRHLYLLHDESSNSPHNSVNLRIRTRNGELRWISHTCAEIRDRSGLILGRRISNVDITREQEQIEDFALAFQESNERYLLLTETMADTAIFVYDEEKGLEFINTKGGSLLGKKPDELLGKRIPDLLTPSQARDAKEVLDRFFATGSPSFIERGLSLAPNDEQSLEIWLFPLDRKGQQTRKVWGLIHDVSEKKRAEKRLVQSLREKDVLLREIHHRVKNNLQQVASLLYLQETRGSTNDMQTALHESRDRIFSMALVHEILINSGDLYQINLAMYLSRLIQNIKGSYDLGSSEVSINIEIDPVISLSLDECISCGLIVNELVSNAMKHAFGAGRKGDVHIRATINGGTITLTVSDTGKGLPESLDVSRPLSLGLQLVTRLVSQIEGTIHVSGPPGTKWIIAFPVKRR